jgi:hypothetical protein
MFQISKRIRNIEKDREAAKRLAAEGRYDESDDLVIEAYANALDLIETYESAMFLDAEIEFLTAVINEFETNE